MYLHFDYHLVKSYSLQHIHTEHHFTVTSPRQDRTIRICVLSLYNHPRTTMQTFLMELELLLAAAPQGIPTIVCGDFNIDIMKHTSSTKQLQAVVRHYGYVQHVGRPTHRKGGCLDHFYTNFSCDDLLLDVIPTYYSDHFVLTAAIPLPYLVH